MWITAKPSPVFVKTLVMLALGGGLAACTPQDTSGPTTAASSTATPAPILSPDADSSDHHQSRLPSRSFRLVYQVDVVDLEPNVEARIWIPVPVTSAHQTVVEVERELPGDPQATREQVHGNSLLYLEATADDQGMIPLKIVYDVTRSFVAPPNYVTLSPTEAELYTLPNRLVPVGGKTVEQLLADVDEFPSAGARAHAFYDLVFDHVDYKKPPGEPWGQGDVAWVCDSRFGNCTDFHSLFISLCRTSSIPARFEIGFPIPEESEGEIGGYHCWAWFAAENEWHPVDISEADKHPEKKAQFFGQLPPDRVALTQGRDLILQPQQDGPPVNFLIDPYIEVAEEPHSKLEKHYRFETREDATRDVTNAP